MGVNNALSAILSVLLRQGLNLHGVATINGYKGHRDRHTAPCCYSIPYG
ncbi:hypothetical protein DZ11F48_42530 [Escherichia coli]